MKNLHPAETGDENHNHLGLLRHFEIPYHHRGNRHDDKVHEDAERTASEHKVQRREAFPSGDGLPIGVDGVHDGLQPAVAHRIAR